MRAHRCWERAFQARSGSWNFSQSYHWPSQEIDRGMLILWQEGQLITPTWGHPCGRTFTPVVISCNTKSGWKNPRHVSNVREMFSEEPCSCWSLLRFLPLLAGQQRQIKITLASGDWYSVSFSYSSNKLLKRCCFSDTRLRKAAGSAGYLDCDSQAGSCPLQPCSEPSTIKAGFIWTTRAIKLVQLV